jgi:YD repeat-containing protein
VALSRLSIRAALLAALAAWPLSASAQLPPPPKEISVDQNGVDVRTGNETWSFRELDIGPEGELGLHLDRHHAEGIRRNSFASTYYMASFGDGFRSVGASFGNMGDTFSSLLYPKGAFIDEGSFKYQSSTGVVVTFNTAMWHQYGPFGDNSEDIYRLADTVTYPSGVKLTIHYRIETLGGLPLARIQSVTSNTGYQIKFRYPSNTPTNQTAFTEPSSAVGINMGVEYCDPNADDCALSQAWPTTTYTPTASGMNVTDPNGGVTQYSGTNSPPGSRSITLPGNSTPNMTFNYTYIQSPCAVLTDHWSSCSMGYGSRVASVVTPDRTTTYSYSGNSNPSYFNQITSTDPGNVTNIFKSQGYSVLGVWSATDPLSRLTKYEYDPTGLITKFTFPEGNFIEYQRDAYGRILHQIAHSKDNATTLTVSQTFGPCAMNVTTCSLPLTVTDARNNLTEYRYNTHGQKTVELGPADQDGVRPLRRWFYSDRYAYTKTSSGALVAAPTSVSVLTSEKVCRTSFNGDLANPACGSTADEVVTTYEYPATAVENALLPRGVVVSADGVSRRTCYAYDRFGNKTSETSPRAGLASCS